MKIIKGEKYICSNGPLRGQLFKILTFTPYHVVCENLTWPSESVEMIVKYYFRESFRAYDHLVNVSLSDIEIQQVVHAVNLRIKTYMDNGMIAESLFGLIANDVVSVMVTEFGGSK